MNGRIYTVEGNIGSGKTSFAKKLAEKYNARLVLETFADNPFLQKFFVKQQDYALGMEMFFMAERYEQLKEEFGNLSLFETDIVIDYLFTKSLLYARVNLDETEYALYQKIFNILNPNLPSSSIIVYLHSETERLVKNIQKRGREFEQTVQTGYLKKIETVYMEYFRQHPQVPTLILDVSAIDFVGNDDDFRKMLEIIESNPSPGLNYYKI